MPVPRLSFEFFPPKNETQMGRFWLTLGHLLTLNPAYISMTWGALGSASQYSLDILQPLVRDCPVPVVAHLTCAGTAEPEMRALIRNFLPHLIQIKIPILVMSLVQRTTPVAVSSSLDMLQTWYRCWRREIVGKSA